MSLNKKKGKSNRNESVAIDNKIKGLISKGVQKAGSRKKLSEIMGYSTPSNMIFQLLSAPRYKKTIPINRLKRLQDFLG